MTNCSPAAAAARVTSSTEPVPSDRIVCTWMTPRTPRPQPRRRRRQITRRGRHHREERYRGNDEKGEAPDQAKHGIRLRPRMKTVVHGAHPLLEHVRVDLRRRQIRVPEHHLNRAQVRAALE